MSNEVIDLNAFRTAKPPALATKLPDMDESLSDGIGSGYGIIGYKGKVWSLRYRNETKVFTRPDDGSPLSYIDVVILRSPPHKAKSFYPSYDPDAAGVRPTCASMDGLVPDTDVEQKQSETCALCPRNVWKVMPNGKKGRECTDYKRLAVLLMPNQTQKLLGAPLLEPVFLRVPPASLQSLATMGDTMKGQGWHYSSFITRISFDANLSHPQMVFRPIRGLTDDEYAGVLKLRDDPTALRIIGEGGPGGGGPGFQPMLAGAPPKAQPALISAPAPQPARPSQPQVADSDPSPTLLVLNPAPQPAPVAAEPTSAPVASSPQVSDVGDAEESDAALDERIANLMKSIQ